MNQNYIDVFASTSLNSIRESMDIQVEKAEITTTRHPSATEGVFIIIGITGDLEGRVIYELSIDTALKIAEAMNYEPFETFDGLARSTISELANIMAGKTISEMNNQGIKIMISPPVLLTGRDLKASDSIPDEVLIYLVSNFGTIIVNLALMSMAMAN
jgi:chemotaxis protein CheX